MRLHVLLLSALLLSALLLSCEEADGRADNVALYYFESLEPHPEVTIDKASDILGLELTVSDTPAHSVFVFFWPGLPMDGEAAGGHECAPTIYANDNGRTLAHEIGHALQLQHVDGTDNLMSSTVSDGTHLTDDQTDTMRWAAWWLQRCS